MRFFDENDLYNFIIKNENHKVNEFPNIDFSMSFSYKTYIYCGIIENEKLFENLLYRYRVPWYPEILEIVMVNKKYKMLEWVKKYNLKYNKKYTKFLLE